MTDTVVFFDEGGVYVSNTRVKTPVGDSYSLRNVTSCNQRYEEHEKIDKKEGRIKSLLFWGGIIVGILAWYYHGL